MIKEALSPGPNYDTQSNVYLLSVDSINDLHSSPLDLERQDAQEAHASTILLPQLHEKVHRSNQQDQPHAPYVCPLERCGPSFCCFSASALLGILIFTCLATLALILHLCVNLAKVTQTVSHKLEDQEEALHWLRQAVSALAKNKQP